MSDRAIIIYDLSHALAALEAAHELGKPVTLLSAPEAALSMGAQVFRDMIEMARRSHPDVEVVAVLDCGEDPGLALGAFREGVLAARVKAQPEAIDRLRDMAAEMEAVLYEKEGPFLDLIDTDDARAACREWLGG